MIPDEEKCIAILEKYDTPPHIVSHSRRVRDIARLLGGALRARDYRLDVDLLCASCLLHDIGKYPCIVNGVGRHDVLGEEILTREGFPQIGDIVSQHVFLRDPGGPIREEHVLFYSDKRVNHDVIVSVSDRFVYLERTYGVTAAGVERLQIMRGITMNLERQIFSTLDFDPRDITALLREAGEPSDREPKGAG
jgi:putative nucleotidyltransferase with HDIG domain